MTEGSLFLGRNKRRTPLLYWIAEVVKERRVMLGLSQHEIASRSGLHRTYICDVERGARTVSMSSLERMATALEVTVSQIVELAEAKRDSQSAASPDASHAYRGPKFRTRVLIVDDSPVNQKIIAHMVASLDFEYDLAADGQEAVRLAERSSYALILMDLRMPNMDGLTAARTIRASGNNVPIIGYSAHPMHDDTEKCGEARMNDFLEKPANGSDFAKALRARISNALPVDRL